MGRNEQPKTELEQRSRELRELLRGDKTDVDQIKAKLTAFRAAKDKANQQLAGARQTLRQLMSLRQEAVLVLNGLLD
jgi:outer membrane protein TolC